MGERKGYDTFDRAGFSSDATAIEIERVNLMTTMQASGRSDLVRMALFWLAEPPSEQ